MKMKKITCAAVASAMALSMSVPALAAVTPVKPLVETTESSFQVELEGMTYTPTIRVQVTESGSVYVNPSKSAVAGTMTKALDGTIDLDYSFAGQTLISTPILIRSDTANALTVSATATATVPKTSGVKLADAKATTADEGKVVTLQLGGNSADGLGDSDALKTTTTPGANQGDPDTVTVGLDMTKVPLVTKAKLTAGTDGKSAKLETATPVATIGAATLNTDPTTKKVTTAVPQYGAIVVGGDANSKATGWTESDVVNVSLALTFAIADS